jgi:hypothetical protein
MVNKLVNLMTCMLSYRLYIKLWFFHVARTSIQKKLLDSRVEGVLFGVCTFTKRIHTTKNLILCMNEYHYYAQMFSTDIINIVRENFDIALWFCFLDCKKTKYFIGEFEWLKDEIFIFMWSREQCVHTSYFPLMHAYICGVLQFYKKMLKDVFMKYLDRYETSNISFIDEGRYDSQDNSEENCLKMPLGCTFDGSSKRDININKVLCSLLNHLRPHPNMAHRLKTFKMK